jgi:fatty acid-binding protein DegV
VALPPYLEERQITQAADVLGRPYNIITQIKDIIYQIQQRTRARMMVVHLDRLVLYLGATWDK